MATKSRSDMRVVRHKRLRKYLAGTTEKPRLSVFKSTKHISAQIIDDTDSEKVLTAITDKIAAVDPNLGDLSLSAIASAVRTELTAELAHLDADVSSRLANADYTAPDNVAIGDIATAAAAVQAQTDQLVFSTAGRVDVLHQQ